MSKRPIREWFSGITTHDFLPWSNRYVAWLRTPIGWFAVAAVAAGLTGAIVAPEGWVTCAIILSAMGLGIAWPWLAMRGLEARIDFDRSRCHEHDEVTVVLTVTNRWPWPVWGLLVQRGFFCTVGTERQPDATALSQVAGWSNSRFEFTYQPPRRGVYPHQPPVLATGFPFGIWSTERTISVNEKLIVWPRTTRLRSVPMLQGDRLAATGSCIDRPGHDGDIIAARPYIRGDSLRRVHWIHTARRDALIVCERQTASRESILVELDPYAFSDNKTALDWGLRVIASLCLEFHSHACDLTCALGKDRLFVAPSTAGLHRLFDRLAAYQPPSPAEGFVNLPRKNVGDQLTILVTSAERWHSFGARNQSRQKREPIRAVVINDGPKCSAEHGKPWIGLTLANEPTRQFQRQWERQCHEDWAR